MEGACGGDTGSAPASAKKVLGPRELSGHEIYSIETPPPSTAPRTPGGGLQLWPAPATVADAADGGAYGGQLAGRLLG